MNKKTSLCCALQFRENLPLTPCLVKQKDAPVSGGVKGATDGTLTFMVGFQSEQDLEIVQPYLDIMGKRTVHCGKPGAGSATKICVSFEKMRRKMTKAMICGISL